MLAYAYYDGNSRIQQYARALRERGDTVDVIALNRGTSPLLEIVDGVNLYRPQRRKSHDEGLLRLSWRLLIFMVRSSVFLVRSHLKHRYDVIHIHSVPDFLVFAAAIPKLMGASIILDIHDILPEFFTSKFQSDKKSRLFKFLVFVERTSIRFSDHVIIANPIWNERLVSRSAKPSKVTTIGNFPDPEFFMPRPRDRHDNKFVITYPGTLNWHQGVDIAVHAFARITNEIPDAEFHIYGEGPEKANIEKLVQDLGLTSKFKIRDYVSTSDIAKVMANTDLAVVPKRSKSGFGTEAASTKILEFMSCGVPVVASRTRIDDLVHTEDRIMFFDNDDPDALADCILTMYKNPALRNRLAMNGLAHAKENSWTMKKQGYFAIVDGLMSAKQDGRSYDPAPESVSLPSGTADFTKVSAKQ